MSSPNLYNDQMTTTIDGHALSEAACERLHLLKNKPVVPTIDGIPITDIKEMFPPYRYRPYPCALYKLNDPESPRLVQDEDEERRFLSRGWVKTPGEMEAKAEQLEADAAVPSAVRAYDDRRMSAKAQAEVTALENATNANVDDVPAPKRAWSAARRAASKKAKPDQA